MKYLFLMVQTIGLRIASKIAFLISFDYHHSLHHQYEMFLSHLFFNVICGKYHTITTFSGNLHQD